MANPPLAVLALSLSTALSPAASAMALPIGGLIHLHPRVRHVDDRIYLSLYNQSPSFREVKIDGQQYTVLAHESLSIKAPVGTIVYADSPTLVHHRGDVILVVAPDLNRKKINLN